MVSINYMSQVWDRFEIANLLSLPFLDWTFAEFVMLCYICTVWDQTWSKHCKADLLWITNHHIWSFVMTKHTYVMPKIHNSYRIAHFRVITAITRSFAILWGVWVGVRLALVPRRACTHSNWGCATLYVAILGSAVGHTALSGSAPRDKTSSCNYRWPRRMFAE